MSVVIAILMFGLIILIHELGHFIAAKACGITVLQFSIGFGPAIVKKKVGDTLYALRIIPLGGAVMMKGEEDGEEALLVGKGEKGEEPTEPLPVLAGDPVPEKGSFLAATKLQRFIVCAAGSIMNLVLGVLIILILMMPAKAVQTPIMSSFMEGFPYEETFQVGDEILKINNMRIYVYGDVTTALMLGEGQLYDVTIKRDGRKIKLENIPLEKTVPDTDGSYKYGFMFSAEEIGFGGKVKHAVNSSMSFLQSAVVSLQMLFTGQAGINDMMGTVGIATEISNQAKVSMSNTWYFVAFISINLAFMNMLPIPALDGGKILFLIIEAIRGKRVSAKVEGAISMVSLVLVLGLFVFVTYNDIARLISG